ncbi:DUF1761 domain-containing protein [Pseudoroseicyclus tamaricis]|uniref:DUF1761 domain-containing protein n=1 Tax=Pseudoroseicyclus tamaricis TaxID=2705421 RepID=A0A6B2K492_9RHOB|nr:DUF1761 domain-containing protein [Pseudoroseicyclus tamaricis]NDV02642.1 DUF1761 domain-containing protein [Pseudoroseicyclus tamaricis]
MGILGILVAAAAAFLFGAGWYMALSKPWMRAAGIRREGGRSAPNSALPFILSALTMLIVAVIMRHIFATSGITTWHGGLTSGLGIGLFFISPWTMINNAYAGRPFLLTVIDGGYATFGCGIIGTILALMA